MVSPGRLRMGARIPVRVRVTVGLAAMAVVVVVSGCAALPSGGAPHQVDTGGNQVQAYLQPLPPPGPKSYHQPGQVVLAFLHASASYAFDPEAARQFLLPALRATWRPGPVTVVNNRIYPPKPSVPAGHSPLDASSGAGPTVSVALTGQRLATLSQTGQYQYSPGTRTYQFSLLRVNGVWLISALPSQNTLLLTQADFQLVYQARSLYFFSLPVRPAISSLVPDPVYAPLWNSDSALNTNLASGLVRGLLNDQGSWISGATATAFPRGTTLHDVRISGQTAVVNLGGGAAHATTVQRQGMVDQLAATLGSAAYSPALARAVQLEINGRTVLSGQGQFSSGLIDGVPAGQLVYESSPGTVSKGLGRAPSLGPAQLGSADITAIAVAPTPSVPQGGAVAVAVKDGKGCAVYKQNTQTGLPRGPYRAVLVATTGGSCTSLSWDSNGNLWAAAGRTVWILGAQGGWHAVGLPDTLLAGGQHGQILALRMAPDGVRAALLVKYGSHRRLVLAAVREYGKQVSLERPVAAESGLSDPMAVSWFTPYALLVLDRWGVEEVPLVGGAAQRVGSAPARADSLTTDGRTIVIGTADDQMQISLPVTAALSTIIWQQKLASGANPIYPG